MSRKYPDRWLDYSKFGSQVEGTPFVPLKVPLKREFFVQCKKNKFTPEDAVEQIQNLGLVIDLTFTAKYYNPKEFERQDVQHKKIYTQGHKIPKHALVVQFIRTVDEFMAYEQNKDKLIGVHCTHGLNRTGYFICAYMILVKGCAPKAAIKLFNEARAHKMERANYLNSLLSLKPFGYKSTMRTSDIHCNLRNNIPERGLSFRNNRYNNHNRCDYGHSANSSTRGEKSFSRGQI
ncbi:RNA/RNP complex-1-interacting phosphatase [Toxorhynchites rutilus septentrionalis]|uniref:RNA/RNP complex-1-interacting phosphatase n=1 Tax=Toxorhynchites rutilus septentrionalis TaxID=329112 RepID=UPI0024783C26|nr:RNA/RNP complex-1-interacting phosphatase [Toxorhynchites rutilus septentrionalis]